MDITELYTRDAHEQGAEMQIKDKTGQPAEMYISLVGMDSKTWRSLMAEQNRKLMAENADVDEIKAETFASATLSWRGFMSKGEEIAFSREKVLELYTQAPYIVDQVNHFVGDRLNFTHGKPDV